MVRGYQRLSPAQIDEIWVRLRAGHAAKPTARALGLPTSTLRTYLLRCGGIRPGPRHRAAGRLRFEEREEISRGLAAGRSLRSIAAGLGRSTSTLSREAAAGSLMAHRHLPVHIRSHDDRETALAIVGRPGHVTSGLTGLDHHPCASGVLGGVDSKAGFIQTLTSKDTGRRRCPSSP